MYEPGHPQALDVHARGEHVDVPVPVARRGEGGDRGRPCVVVVPLVSSAPTAITNGSIAGSVSRFPGVLPELTTTTIPLRQATSAAYASGSTVYVCSESVPKDRFSTRMLKPGSCGVLDDPVDRGDDLGDVGAAVARRRP